MALFVLFVLSILVVLAVVVIWAGSPWWPGLVVTLALLVVFRRWAKLTTKKILADMKMFWAMIRENSALAIQIGGVIIRFALRLDAEHYERILKLYGRNDDGWRYNPFVTDQAHRNVTFEQLPEHLKFHYVLSPDGFVKVGSPFWGLHTVRAWFPTRKHEEATSQSTHTIPMGVEVVNYLMPLSDDPQKGQDSKSPKRLFQERLDAARNGGKKLDPSDAEKLMMLSLPETADGFSVGVTIAVSHLMADPKTSLTAQRYFGEYRLSLVDGALQFAMKDLRAVDVLADAADTAAAQKVLMHEINEALGVRLGFDQPEKSLFERMEDPNDHTPRAVLARLGDIMINFRVVDIELPERLKVELQKPALSRAQMTASLIDADARVQVAQRGATAKEHEGDGERRFREKVAAGDEALIKAWGGPANRLQALGMEVYRDAVGKPGQGKAVIVGTPGAPLNSADAIAGGLAAAVTTIAGASKGKDEKKGKDEGPKEGGSK